MDLYNSPYIIHILGLLGSLNNPCLNKSGAPIHGLLLMQSRWRKKARERGAKCLLCFGECQMLSKTKRFWVDGVLSWTWGWGLG